jgi:hypothetical protein
MAHRTALIAAGSIAIVIVAGVVAVGANLGILNAADSRPVGKLSASTSTPATSTQPTTPVAAAAPAAPAAPQKYVIKKVGSVSISLIRSRVRLNDISAKRGWKWSLTQTTGSKLTVTFKRNAATYTFVAAMGKHDTIVARVDQPITKVMPAAASSGYVIASTRAPVAPVASAQPKHSGEGDGGGGHSGGDHADD